MDVTERFLKYVSYDTRSDEHAECFPSTPGQRVLGQALAEEMKALGLADVRMDENGYVFGWLPATPGYENRPVLGFLAHMDTSPDVSGAGVRPQTVTYEGGDIRLANGAVISAEAFPSLSRYVGQRLIVTDGSTLLGADDKAGIAEILSACAYLAVQTTPPSFTCPCPRTLSMASETNPLVPGRALTLVEVIRGFTNFLDSGRKSPRDTAETRKNTTNCSQTSPPRRLVTSAAREPRTNHSDTMAAVAPSATRNTSISTSQTIFHVIITPPSIGIYA